MATGNAGGAPAGTGVASFKVPRPWESNVPKFTTEDKDDLRDFIEQVDDIIELAKIADDDEKKKLLTSYLPVKKRETWRELTEYAAGTSYVNFKKAVLKVYPEVQENLDGTLEELEELCAENRNIRRSEEGKLTRFGMRFRALVKKLSKAPAIILNKEACRRYLDALERGFAESLRTAINTRNLIKEDLRQAGVNPPAAGTVDHRKEDPILLEELIKMAERLASTGGTEVTWGEPDAPEIRRSDRFPTVKLERRDARLEELGGEMSSLRDAMSVVQKQSKAAHEELMKAFHNMKSSPSNRDENDQRDSANRSGGMNGNGMDRQFGRGYGQGGGGKDQPRYAFEEYWQRKGTAGQHYAESFYGGAPEDEFDALRDEVRTLRVKLNQVQTRSPPSFNPTTPTMQMQAQVQPFLNQAAPTPALNMEELGRTVFNMMKIGGAAQEQYAQTRSKARTVGFADPPEQDF
ncbi:hypothetical protein DFH08DRAFT_961858 [Mycena albidolilacea]|uniref:Uncharacterized protein n=1 Tax=Mycena albidolilacea TaxID=1033008 RepID=A0AAD7EQ21_9AGAR|nr:hypothetical protein DFH08DRAFT_961858 [Mycena albidolilacea]